jgi:hypothetical protein
MLKKIFLTKSTLSKFCNIREGYSKQEDQDVQGAIESPHGAKSYMGKTRRLEAEFPSFFSDPSKS